MIGRAEVNLFLGIVNGWLAILIIAMFICLLVYVISIKKQFNLSWKEIFTDKRPGLKLARPMMLVKLGLALSCIVTWGWRLISGSGIDGSMSPTLFTSFLVSILILTGGGIWLVRTLTVSRSGEAAWLITLAVLLFYLTVNIFVYII